MFEYLDYFYKDGDVVYSCGVGDGLFLNSYFNEVVLLIGVVYILNVFDLLDNLVDFEFMVKLLGLDNVFVVLLL